MTIRSFALLLLFFLNFQPIAAAEGEHPQFFHTFVTETDIGESESGAVVTWDVDGWLGGDYHKLWLKSEGEVINGDTHQAELWAMYSRNIADFWDAQVGARYDAEPHSTSYLTAGLAGLAPYYFDTEGHLFVSDEGDLSMRLHQEVDLLLTQRLIMQPYVELDLYAQDVPESEVGAGFTAGEFGLQTRYEITRKFAPYLDLSYARSFGETAGIIRRMGEEVEDFIASIGLRLMF